MHVAVDISVFQSPTEAAGRFIGFIEPSVLPRVGEIISFNFPPSGAVPISITGFTSQLKVGSVMHLLDNSKYPIVLALEPIVLASANDLGILVSFMEKGFGIAFEAYD